MNARLPLRSWPFAVVSLAFTTVTSRADIYYNAGVGDLYLRRTNEASVHLLRGEARVGWRFKPWLSLEASAYSCRGTSAADRTVTPPVDPAMNVIPRADTVIVWDRYRYPGPRIHVDAGGFAIGPLISLPISENVRLISRQKILRSRIREWHSNSYDLQPRQTAQQLGIESSLGLTWQPPHRERWEIGAEVLFAQTSRATMTTLLGSVSFHPARVASVAAEERPRLYAAAGAGPVALRWQTHDATSITAGREFTLGWKLTPWLAAEVAALNCGPAVNSRQEVNTYRYYISPTESRQVTYITPWTLEREVSAASIGPRFEWPLAAGFSVVTRQQAAVVTLVEQGDLNHDKQVYRSWVYRPGIGFDWRPPGVRWLKVKVEGCQARTARVRMVAWLASAAVEF